MRVTVCFGPTRVIVPCKGGATVDELVKEACARYKKAIGQNPRYRVKIRQLEHASDGGILDLDDYVYDVAEDRDQLIAVFDEEGDQQDRYNGNNLVEDSGSDGHRSPQIFQSHQNFNNRFLDGNNRGRSKAPTGNATVIKHDDRKVDHEVNVGADALKSGSNSSITVRGTQSSNMGEDGRIKSPPKKSSGYSHIYDRSDSGIEQKEDSHSSESVLSPSDRSDSNFAITTDKIEKHNFGNKIQYGGGFSRGNARQSIMGYLSGDCVHEDRYEDDSYQLMIDQYLPPPPANPSFFPRFYKDSQETFVDIDERKLGIEIRSYRENRVFLGLMVESVETGGRSDREGLLQEGDIIVEINNHVLAHYSYTIAQEIFKDAMRFRELQLRVYPNEERERDNQSFSDRDMQESPLKHKHIKSPSIPVLSLTEPTPPKPRALSSAKSLPNLNDSNEDNTSQDVSPDGKSTLLSRMTLDTLSNNTRKIGNMFEIELKKGVQGLGFSITTRDTPIGGAGPIYVKNILPKGAAVHDGRLRAGDRLLQVNDVELTGHSQESAVNILRCIEVGSTVKLVVSRHVNILPRKMEDDPIIDKALSDDTNREYFKFEIALNDTGSAGLGISLKGNQSKKTKRDLGIFVKSVFHGGAAHQDGRLKPNDQLIKVNGQSLIGMTNHEAIDTLRTSMSTVGNVRGMIQMVIARRKVTANELYTSQFSSEASSEISDSLGNERGSRSSKASSCHSQQSSSPASFSVLLNESYTGNNFRRSSNSSLPLQTMGNNSHLASDCGTDRHKKKYTPRSPADVSLNNLHKRRAPFRRHSSLRTTNKERLNFAETVNRYTHSSGVSSTPQYKDIISNMVGTAAIDNHYRPKRITPRSGRKCNERCVDYGPISPSYSDSLRYKSSIPSPLSPPAALPKRGQTNSLPHFSQRFFSPVNSSASGKLTAVDNSGNSPMEDDYIRYSKNVPRQIDPSPYESNRDYPDGDHQSSDLDFEDPNIDPFSRESIFRQSISEKRKGAASRDTQNIDMVKVLRNKQLASEKVEKKLADLEPPKQPPSPSLKWIKPSRSRKNSSSNSTPSKQPARSESGPVPIPAKRNFNNSSNYPVNGAEQWMNDSGPGMAYPQPLGSNASMISSIPNLKNSYYVSGFSPPKPHAPPRYRDIVRPSKSKEALNAAAISSSDTDSFPLLKKSNSSDSIMNMGLYAGDPSIYPLNVMSHPSQLSTTSKDIPHFKPPTALPNSDFKQLVACCTTSEGSLKRRYLSPPYYKRRKQHSPLTARNAGTPSMEQEVQVGPTLGFAKSSSLESLQTALENLSEDFPKAQPRVLRGRVLNESFRAALDQSYDLETLGGKPMATLREESNGAAISPLVKSEGDTATRTQEKKRGGKGYKLFGLFKVGKNKRSISSDRNLDSNSSTSSSPQLAENEAHKKFLEATREDDFRKHQEETERIQAAKREMRERQEKQRKLEEMSKSRNIMAEKPVEDRVRAPSVPVTAMQRMSVEPKVMYSDISGRRSVDPIAMRNSQTPTFDWNTPKRPTSPVSYEQTRHRRAEKKSSKAKYKINPDYSSLPRQVNGQYIRSRSVINPYRKPGTESNSGVLQNDSDGIVGDGESDCSDSKSGGPPPYMHTTKSGVNGADFNNYQFYNMQKPPSGREIPSIKQSFDYGMRNSTTQRKGRSNRSKAGRPQNHGDPIYTPSATARSKTPQPQPCHREDYSPRKSDRSSNVTTDFATINRTFQREQSPEPPPVVMRRHTRGNAPAPSSYRHSVHVDSQVGRTFERCQPPTSRERSQRPSVITSYWQNARPQAPNHDHSDSDRAASPSASTVEINRNAVKKILDRTRFVEKRTGENFVISQPYNL